VRGEREARSGGARPHSSGNTMEREFRIAALEMRVTHLSSQLTQLKSAVREALANLPLEQPEAVARLRDMVF